MQMPAIADNTDGPGVRERFLQSPSGGRRDDSEWREYVHPELLESFGKASDSVRRDLAGASASADDDGHALDIPLEHAEAWLNCLNRARLALATSHDLDEQDMTREIHARIESARQFAIFQVHFYGVVQECLIQEIAPGGDNPQP